MISNIVRYKVPFLKRLIPSIKKRWSKIVSRNGFFIRKSMGAWFLLNYTNFVDRQILFYGDFGAEQLTKFEEYMRAYGCDLFLDIGANFGYYSIIIAKHGLAKRIIAFEPDERNLLQLGGNILINRLIGKIEVIPKAVTAFPGHVQFQPASESSTGQSKVVEGTVGITVEAISLNNFIKAQGTHIFIKMDIERHEIEAIRGMIDIIATNKIFIQVESFPANYPQLFNILSGMGLRHCGSINADHYFSNF